MKGKGPAGQSVAARPLHPARILEKPTSPRFHGRIPGDRLCSESGCDAPGEFRAPSGRGAGFDGPGSYRWLCLDHVREFNARYNFFTGMTAEEIVASQAPYAGWERETRAFASSGADAPPKWADFKDPMDALGARFRKVRERAAEVEAAQRAGVSPEVAAAYRTLGLAFDADRREVRTAYTALVRRYHPDRNGGDRRHEAQLQAVVAAYQRLKR